MTIEEKTKPVTICCIYSQQDEELYHQLFLHLSGIRRLGLIESWHDNRITPGADWSEEIDQSLHTAHILLLLISPDFIASRFISSKQAQIALKKHKYGQISVIPVLLQPAEWRDTPLRTLQMLPEDARPVSTWSDIDEAFAEVVRSIHALINQYWTVDAFNQKARRLSHELQQSLYEIDLILQEIKEFDDDSQRPSSYPPDDWRKEYERTLTALRSNMMMSVYQCKQFVGEWLPE